MTNYDIKLGETFAESWVFQDSVTTDPINIESDEFSFVIKDDFDTSDANAAVNKSGSDMTLSTATVSLTLASTVTEALQAKEYYWSLKWKDTSKSNFVVVVDSGTFRVDPVSCEAMS